MNRVQQLEERIEKNVAEGMRDFYRARLASLVSTRASDDAWASFERRLRVAEVSGMNPRDITVIRERIEALPVAMQSYYLTRLDGLLTRQAGAHEFEALARKLAIAEDLAGGIRHTPAVRLRRGGH